MRKSRLVCTLSWLWDQELLADLPVGSHELSAFSLGLRLTIGKHEEVKSLGSGVKLAPMHAGDLGQVTWGGFRFISVQ